MTDLFGHGQQSLFGDSDDRIPHPKAAQFRGHAIPGTQRNSGDTAIPGTQYLFWLALICPRKVGGGWSAPDAGVNPASSVGLASRRAGGRAPSHD